MGSSLPPRGPIVGTGEEGAIVTPRGPSKGLRVPHQLAPDSGGGTLCGHNLHLFSLELHFHA